MSLIIKRLTPYLVPILAFIFLEIAFKKPSSGWIFLLIAFVVGLAALVNLSIFKLNKKTAHLVLPGVLFLISYILFFFFLILASPVFKHIFAVLIIFIFAVALEIIFRLFYNQKESRGCTIFFSYLNLLTAFMLVSSISSIGIFLGVASWILYIIATLLFFIIFTNNYYLDNLAKNTDKSNLTPILAEKIENLIFKTKSEKLLFTVIPTLAIVEIFWSLSFLPTGLYVNAFILTVSYYLIAGLIKNRLTSAITKKLIRKYLIIGGACLILIILTARV